jgi:hypothetical protein
MWIMIVNGLHDVLSEEAEAASDEVSGHECPVNYSQVFAQRVPLVK